MEYLIKNVTIISPDTKLHRTVSDILISKGVISKIRKKISAPKAKKIESAHLHCSIGWVDIGTYVGEPGFEHRETLESVSQSAIAGGYTTIAPFPNTNPAVQNKASIQYLLSASKLYGIEFIPIGAISKDVEGQEMAEMLEMNEAGALAFSDGLHPIRKSGLLLRALQYAKRIEGLIIHHPIDLTLDSGGMMHEGKVSTMLGVKGSPEIAEEVCVQRDLKLVEYAESRLMLHAISSGASVELIKKYKKKGLELYASVPYLNLIDTDNSLQAFSSNHKVHPHLRSVDDRMALTKGLHNKIIDIICSNHVPLEEECKKLEFSYADFGAIGLETCFAGLNSHLGDDFLDTIVSCLTVNPRKALRLETPEIKVGNQAELTLFDPSLKWTCDEKSIKSKSMNSPFLGKELIGKPLGIIRNGKFLSMD